MNLNEKEKKWLLEEKYSGERNEAFFSDLKKLKSGTPLAFLIGSTDFINTKIDLSFKPLIPRPETEFWIYEYIFPKLKNFAKQNSSLKILDIFSGSGCIGLSILNNFKHVEVDFGEIKTKNIFQIEKNIKINNLEDTKFHIFSSDIFKKIPQRQYDLILANPPYISENWKNTMQDSVLYFEDELALFADDDGLYFIKKLILKSKEYLSKKGELWIEFDHRQKIQISDFLKEKKIQNFEFFLDQYNKTRFIRIEFL